MSRRVPRLFFAFLAVAGLILATGLFSTWQLGALRDHLDEEGARAPTLDLVRQFDTLTDRYRRTQLQHVIETDPLSLRAIEGEIDQLGRRADDILARVNPGASEEDRVYIDEVKAE